MEKSSKKQTKAQTKEVCTEVHYNLSNGKTNQRLEGEAMLQQVQIYAPVKIKGYKYAF